VSGYVRSSARAWTITSGCDSTRSSGCTSATLIEPLLTLLAAEAGPKPVETAPPPIVTSVCLTFGMARRSVAIRSMIVVVADRLVPSGVFTET